MNISCKADCHSGGAHGNLIPEGHLCKCVGVMYYKCQGPVWPLYCDQSYTSVCHSRNCSWPMWESRGAKLKNRSWNSNDLFLDHNHSMRKHYRSGGFVVQRSCTAIIVSWNSIHFLYNNDLLNYVKHNNALNHSRRKQKAFPTCSKRDNSLQYTFFDLNVLWPSDPIWRQRNESTSSQVMLVAWQHQVIT